MSATSLTWGGRCIPGPDGLPAVVVSLTGPSLAQARAQAHRAIDAGADVLELRVDLLEEAGVLTGSAPMDAAAAAGAAAAQVLECLRGLGEAIAADGIDADVAAPLLLTCRTAAEGGRARLDDASYGTLLRSVLDGLADWAPERRPVAIDVEVQRGCLPQVCTQAHGLGIDVVASFHDFEATPADEVLEEVLTRMAREGADLAKIAVWPTGADDVARLLGVCARATADAGEGTGLGVPVAAMSMGALGAVSRVAPAFGSALTFAVVPDEQGQARASAPGQLPIQDVRRCLELLRA
ncbi:type I 3-dehydroquinate dehydratase [Actinomyces oris]|uniref:type I 3-dehydroquinate dehydratase n=1 Tax=Actinomyces oris TaxID=544580 RepID=UPI0028E192AF|nr:type I 3-dehydroquinate dehydratase [Actinomyces oris]